MGPLNEQLSRGFFVSGNISIIAILLRHAPQQLHFTGLPGQLGCVPSILIQSPGQAQGAFPQSLLGQFLLYSSL